jgi:hypothetical protein
MPILTARLNELLVMTGINAATLRSDRLRKTSVAAFGVDHPVLEERCLLIDGVAMLVRDDLSRDASRAGMPRRGAAMVVRGFFDKWIEAVARIEHRGEDVLFVVAEQAEGIWWCGTGLAAQLPDFIRNQPPRRLFCVNIAAILLAMRSRAEKAGYDLTGGSFFLPPDHELYLQWVKEFRERREVAQQQFDPLHMKPPRSLSVPQRRTIETASCRIN